MTVEAEFGSIETINGLKWWLEQAETKRNIHYMAIGAVQSGHKIAYDYFGSNGVENLARDALKIVDNELGAVIKQRQLGKPNLDLSASYVEWHCSGTPMCWDFLIWLVQAEMDRIRLGGDPPLRVAFTRTETLSEKKRKFFENVYWPLLPLIGAVEDKDAVGGRHKPIYVTVDIVARARSGEKVPILRASDTGRETMRMWLHDIKPITVTLREAGHWPKRNSNLKAWLKFADDMKKKGETVIFIRDTEFATAGLPKPDYWQAPMCAHNIDLRMALYEQAKINLGISNGPFGLCLFSEVPYLYFVNQQRGDKTYIAHKSEWWHKSNGIKPGEDWPWAKPGQKMIWRRDTYNNICEAWEQYRPK